MIYPADRLSWHIKLDAPGAEEMYSRCKKISIILQDGEGVARYPAKTVS